MRGIDPMVLHLVPVCSRDPRTQRENHAGEQINPYNWELWLAWDHGFLGNADIQDLAGIQTACSPRLLGLAHVSQVGFLVGIDLSLQAIEFDAGISHLGQLLVTLAYLLVQGGLLCRHRRSLGFGLCKIGLDRYPYWVQVAAGFLDLEVSLLFEDPLGCVEL